MLDKALETVTENLVGEIKETETYKEYFYRLNEVKKDPELFRQVNEFRQKNYDIQNATGEDELFEKVDAFEREYEKFRENPVVDAFLRAELAFCRLMQEVYVFITEELDFE